MKLLKIITGCVFVSLFTLPIIAFSQNQLTRTKHLMSKECNFPDQIWLKGKILEQDKGKCWVKLKIIDNNWYKGAKWFRLKNCNQLQNLKPGDTINFSLFDDFARKHPNICIPKP
ncbi:MAG: hypothetical protein Q9M37_08645 [Desulfonauticus sp.]|nr:hypothetical protein [Desulfonauticus sp.]